MGKQRSYVWSYEELRRQQEENAKLAQGIGSALNTGIDMLRSFTAGSKQTGLQSGISSAISNIPSLIQTFGGSAAASGIASGVLAGAKAADAITNLAGIAPDVVSSQTAARAGISSGNKATEILSSIPFASTIMSAFGKKMDKAYESSFAKDIGSGYGTTLKDTDAAKDLSGKTLVFGKKKANKFIQESNMANAMLDSIGMQSEMAKNNNSATLYNSQNYNLYSGYKPTLLLAKEGVKLSTTGQQEYLKLLSLLTDMSTLVHSNPIKNAVSTVVNTAVDAENGLSDKELRTMLDNILLDQSADDPDSINIKISKFIEDNRQNLKKIFERRGQTKVVEQLENINDGDNLNLVFHAIQNIVGPVKFQLGGKIIKPTKNIIPDGALHKNRNHLGEKNEELAGQITEKGIPVVSENPDGSIEQHAEIEVGEVVFTLEVTQTIENYWKEYNETHDAQIAIECGKYVTKQLLHNTVDKAGVKNNITNA